MSKMAYDFLLELLINEDTKKQKEFIIWWQVSYCDLALLLSLSNGIRNDFIYVCVYIYVNALITMKTETQREIQTTRLKEKGHLKNNIGYN